MKFKQILFGIMIVLMLLVSVAGALATSLKNNMISYYALDENSGSIATDSVGFTNLTLYNSPTWTTGKINYGLNLDGSNDYLSSNDNVNVTGSAPRTLNVWARPDKVTGDQYIVGIGNSSINNQAFFINIYNGKARVVFIGSDFNSPTTLTAGQWYMFTAVYTGSSVLFYINGNYDGTYSQSINTANSKLFIGSNSNNVFFFDGLIDEVGFWNVALNSSQITELYNNSAGYNPYSTPSPAPDILTFVVTAKDTFNNATINNFSATIDAETITTTNGSIYFTYNTTLNNYSYRNITVFNAYINTGTFENITILNWNISNNLEANLTRIAPVSPLITINPSNFFTTTNISTINQYIDVPATFNITFSDDALLYAYQINVTNTTGGSKYSILNSSLTGTTTTFTHTLNTSTWNDGVYTINITVADAHTLNKIPDYKVTSKKSSINFKTQNDNNIKIETQEQSTKTVRKLDDRYTFTMKFDDGLAKTRDFRVKTDKCKLDYLSHSPYQAHFVSFCNGDGNWIDFEGISGDVRVEKIDDYDYRVTITDVPPTITFNSIGSLNVRTETYTWYKGNYSLFSPNFPVGDIGVAYSNWTQNNNYTNNISTRVTINSGLATSVLISSSPFYSYTHNYTAPSTAGAHTVYYEAKINQRQIQFCDSYTDMHLKFYGISLPYLIPYCKTDFLQDVCSGGVTYTTPCHVCLNATTEAPGYFEYGSCDNLITPPSYATNYDYSFNVTSTTTPYTFGIVACDATYNTPTINITYYDENYPTTKINNILEYKITTWINNETNTKTYNGNRTQSSQHLLCLFPSHETIHADIYLKYSYPGTYTHKYIAFNETYTNTTTLIPLYNFKTTTGISKLKVTTRKNEDYNFYPNILVKLQRRYVDEGVYRTVQYDQTDENGLVVFDVIERDVDYKLLYIDTSNNLLKSTEQIKFVCDSALCDITQLIKSTSTFTEKRKIVANNVYSNKTKMITTTWRMLDAENAVVTYQVYWKPLTTNYLVCNETTTASSGTFTCNMTGYTGTALVILDVKGNSWSSSEMINLIRQTIRDVISQGDSVFITIAILLVIGLSGLVSPLAVIIMTVFAVIMMATLGVFTGFTAGALVVTVILGIMLAFKVRG